MPRYEFSEGSSNKFWDIKLDGKAFTTTYGKIGANGQTTIKSFKSSDDAKREYDKLIAEKTKKGYVLAGGKPAKAAAPVAKPKAAAPAKATAKPAPAASAGGGKPGERYFEFVEGSSSKFWAVAIDGASVATRYGKIGTAGQTTVKDFDGKADAFKEYDKLVAEKTKKGYAEKTAAGGGGPALDQRNPELEKAIVADPSDREAYSVYADWLQQHGDPRGELIALQLAGKTKAATTLFDKHADYFLGPLAEHTKCYDGDLGNNARQNPKDWIAENQQAFLWQYGFIRRARLAHDEYIDEEFEGTLAEVLELLLRHPSGRFVSELAFNSNGDPNDNDLQDLIDILAKQPRPALRTIVIGDNVDQISWYNVGKLGKLWKAVPNLTSLQIEAGSFALGELDLPQLQRAVFETGGLSKASAKSIATAKWPRIAHLDVYYGDDNYGGDCTVKDALPLLARTDLKSLTHLGLKNSMFADQLCEELASAKILRQLKQLDLSLGCMSDVGAAHLAAHKDAFEHLDVLDLSENYLSKDGIKAVKGLAKKVIVDGQRDDEGDPEYRHPRVAE